MNYSESFINWPIEAKKHWEMLTDYVMHKIKSTVLDFLQIEENSNNLHRKNVKILDLWWWFWEMSKYLNKVWYNSISLDIRWDIGFNKWAKQIRWSAYELPFIDNSFDFVNANAFFDNSGWFSMYDHNFDTLLLEISRVLKVGWLIFISDPFPPNSIDLRKYFTQLTYNTDGYYLWWKK